MGNWAFLDVTFPKLTSPIGDHTKANRDASSTAVLESASAQADSLSITTLSLLRGFGQAQLKDLAVRTRSAGGLFDVLEESPPNALVRMAGRVPRKVAMASELWVASAGVLHKPWMYIANGVHSLRAPLDGEQDQGRVAPLLSKAWAELDVAYDVQTKVLEAADLPAWEVLPWMLHAAAKGREAPRLDRILRLPL